MTLDIQKELTKRLMCNRTKAYTGELVEYTKTSKLLILKELGKLTP